MEETRHELANKNERSWFGTHLCCGFAEKMNVCAVDLCCGMGGLSLAARNLGIQILAGVDTDASALKTFSRNFPEARAIGTDVSCACAIDACAALLNDPHDENRKTLMISGPPCQGFSAAGSRNPEDPRNAVLLAVSRAITHIQPDCALIENVPAMLLDKNAFIVEAFKAIITEGGFTVSSAIVNAVDYGVAQLRRRAFFLITRTGLCDKTLANNLACLKLPPRGVAEVFAGLPQPRVRPDKYHDEMDCEVIPNHFTMRHSQTVVDKIANIEQGCGPMSYRRLHPARPSNTLFSGHRAPPAHYADPRSITVREAARLQGFPDSFRVYGSFANQMEQVTNAVPPPLARVVLSVLAGSAGLTVNAND